MGMRLLPSSGYVCACHLFTGNHQYGLTKASIMHWMQCKRQHSSVEEHIFEAGQSLFSVILPLMAQVNSAPEQASSDRSQDVDRDGRAPDVRSNGRLLFPRMLCLPRIVSPPPNQHPFLRPSFSLPATTQRSTNISRMHR